MSRGRKAKGFEGRLRDWAAAVGPERAGGILEKAEARRGAMEAGFALHEAAGLGEVLKKMVLNPPTLGGDAGPGLDRLRAVLDAWLTLRGGEVNPAAYSGLYSFGLVDKETALLVVELAEFLQSLAGRSLGAVAMPESRGGGAGLFEGCGPLWAFLRAFAGSPDLAFLPDLSAETLGLWEAAAWDFFLYSLGPDYEENPAFDLIAPRTGQGAATNRAEVVRKAWRECWRTVARRIAERGK